jgi:hypothetical protein
MKAIQVDEEKDITKSTGGQVVQTFLPRGANHLTTGDLAYIAGFFDGEGCVQVRKRGNRWEAMLRFINTSYPIMRWIADVTGGSLSTRKSYGPNRRRSFEVCLQHTQAEHWARLLRPYLRIKADEIDLLLEFRKTISENHRKKLSDEVDQYRHDIAWSCGVLKRRAY